MGVLAHWVRFLIETGSSAHFFLRVSSRWTPDPTFLEESPVMTQFPQGDISTAALGVFIGKIVSHDLSALAPRLVGFLDNIAIDIDTINSMMLDQKTSGSCVFTKCCSREVLQTHVLFNASEYFMYIVCTAVPHHDSEGGCQATTGSLRCAAGCRTIRRSGNSPD